MGLGKSLNQSLQGGLEKIGYTSSNGPPGNCCKVSNKYLIGHVIGEQNGGFTVTDHTIVVYTENEIELSKLIGESALYNGNDTG